MPPDSPSFRVRRFATFVLALSFVAAAVSGVVLFIRPEGSIARWVGWSVFGMAKKQWEAIHVVFVIAFLVVSLVHIWYNWKPLVAYFKRKTSGLPSAGTRLTVSRELAAALGVTALMLAGTLAEWQPFSSLMDVRSAVKDGKFVAVAPPPVPEADRMTLHEVCRQVGLPQEQALDNARRRGIVIRDASSTLAVIASEHRVSPEDVYRALRGEPRTEHVRP